MKKLLIIIAIALLTVSSHASPTKSGNKKSSINQPVKKQLKVAIDFQCTVTITGTVGYGSTNISVSCAATADDCDKASSQAVSCVGSTITAVRKALKALV